MGHVLEMNDTKIMNRLQEHLNSALAEHPRDWFVICLQGSQNYGLADEESDIDSKLLTLPSMRELVLNLKSWNHVHIMPNEEHVDMKDSRDYFKIFRKSNINFVEILFTPYWIANPFYDDLWYELLSKREELARINPYAAVSCMKGMAGEKLHALCHEYPSRMPWIEKYGYDCYSEDTYFLTKRGWLHYDEITSEDELGTINPDTLALEFQSYTDRVKKSGCTTYTLESWYSKFEITENHNLFCSDVVNINKNGAAYDSDTAKWHLEPFITQKNKNKHILSFPYNANVDNSNYSDDFLQILGAYISEGTLLFYPNGKIKSVNIAQTNHGKQEFFEMMDAIQDFPKHKYSYPREDKYDCISTLWTFSDSALKNKIYSIAGHMSLKKHIDYDFLFSLSKRQARVLLKAMLLGDGSKDKDSPRWIYYTASKQLGKDVLILGHLAGYECNLLGGEDGYYYPEGKSTFGNTPMWQISIRDKELSPSCINVSLSNCHSAVKEQKENQTVVCFSVPNGTLVTMKDGKTAAQGNCKQLSHLVRIKFFLDLYISGAPYEDCINLTNPEHKDLLMRLKRNGDGVTKEEAVEMAENTFNYIVKRADDFRKKVENKNDPELDEFLNDVLYRLVSRSIERGL